MVCDFFHPNIGGVENHIYILAVNLLQRGHKVVIVTHSYLPSRVGIRWLVPGLKVYHVPLKVLISNATLPNYLTFLPYIRNIVLRERITIVHGHASLSSYAQEAILHAHLFGSHFESMFGWWRGREGKEKDRKGQSTEHETRREIRTVFTDHSLFALDDATGILTNKLLAAALNNVDAVICVSHTARENTILRANLDPRTSYVIPSAIIAEQFRPPSSPLPIDPITIVVVSRLAYRKGIDLLVASAPRICSLYPNVNFLIGGSGPKLINLLQMREAYRLQDRITLLGAVNHHEVRDILVKGNIYLNTSLTESFGIGLLEAACAGCFIVSTRVGGVPEVLPKDMIEFAMPNEDDVVRALTKAIKIVTTGKHDPQQAHERVKSMYTWDDVACRTEKVYEDITNKEPVELWTRMHKTLRVGPFAGIIYLIILIVECLFFLWLELVTPRRDIHYVEEDWKPEQFRKVAREEKEREHKEDQLDQTSNSPVRQLY
ncbi:hypothetical protein FS842_005556 [Serendipita sp. 407]|nr:hypothetical protein FS842_005556 [Serendipita sp. 407]